MRLVDMDKIEAAARHECVDGRGGPGAQAKPRHFMHRNSFLQAAHRQGRIARRHHLGLKLAFPQATQRQQCLALAATPFAL